MNMMPGFAPKPGDLTRHDPSMTPYTIEPELVKSRRGVVLNAAREPIAIIEANSATQLMEISRIIEQAFRERDELLDEVRCLREKERNLNQRRR
jgi:hypothetical protein